MQGVSPFHKLFQNILVLFSVKLIELDTTIYLPTKVTLAFTLEHHAGDQGTKVQISEDNTKQKTKFLHKL